MPGDYEGAVCCFAFCEVQPAFSPYVEDVIIAPGNWFCAAVRNDRGFYEYPLLIFVMSIIRYNFSLSFGPVLKL